MKFIAEYMITLLMRLPLTVLAMMQLKALGSSDIECFLLASGMILAYNFSLTPIKEGE